MFVTNVKMGKTPAEADVIEVAGVRFWIERSRKGRASVVIFPGKHGVAKYAAGDPRLTKPFRGD